MNKAEGEGIFGNPSNLRMIACIKKRNLLHSIQHKGPDNTSISKGPDEYTHFNQQRDLVKITISISRGTW
jgi:hypothetical protein